MVKQFIDHQMHIRSSNKLRDNYDDLIMSRSEIWKSVWIVLRKKEDVFKDKPNSYVPHHLGSYIRAHSRRLMIYFILALDGFKNLCVAYSDTHSIYIKKIIV
jgi:hypothetical protein